MRDFVSPQRRVDLLYKYGASGGKLKKRLDEWDDNVCGWSGGGGRWSDKAVCG